MVEDGYNEIDDEAKLRENRNKDAKALFSFIKDFMKVFYLEFQQQKVQRRLRRFSKLNSRDHPKLL